MTLSPQQEAQRLDDTGSWHLIPDAISVDVDAGVALTPRGEVRGALRVIDVASSDDAESIGPALTFEEFNVAAIAVVDLPE